MKYIIQEPDLIGTTSPLFKNICACTKFRKQQNISQSLSRFTFLPDYSPTFLFIIIFLPHFLGTFFSQFPIISFSYLVAILIVSRYLLFQKIIYFYFVKLQTSMQALALHSLF
jgi:hypothetical protein